MALALLALPLPARGDSYRLLLSRDAPAPVRFAGDELARDLAAAGHPAARGRGGVVITAAMSGAVGPESFTLQRQGSKLRVVGGDAVGAMYGLFEIGEQALRGAGMPLLEAVRPTIRRPYLPLRADSPTLWLGPGRQLPRLLADGAFWRRYLTAMARGRFDLLHLHGFLDPATGRSRSLFERLMPAAGAPDAGARQFVADLHSLAALCRERGIRLAVTDDAAGEAPAAAASAHRLVAAVPGLWGVGARVAGADAAGLSAALARQVAPRAFLSWPDLSSEYSAAVAQARLSASSGGRSLAVLPVNGGSFALPYPLLASDPLGAAPANVAQPAVQAAAEPEATPRADPRFLRLDRPGALPVLWDVPAGRIAPSLPWCDPEFIRRLVRSLGTTSTGAAGARGLLLEPPPAFFPSLAPPPAVPAIYPAALQPVWWWHRAWGRLAYDPSEPESHLVAAFQRRYGKEPGWHIQEVLARISAVAPLIAALESQPSTLPVAAPEQDPGSLAGWEVSPSLDPAMLLDIPTWAGLRLAGETDGRLDPVQVSFRLAETAMRVRNEVDTVEILHPQHLEEWHALRRQIEALCHLADFGARRLSAAAHLELYRRTGDEMELELATGHAGLAAISWAAMQRMLAPGGEKEVGHMTMPAEPPPLEGPFAADGALLAQSQAELADALGQARTTPRIAHVPIERATPTRAQRIAATVMSGADTPTVTLAYRLVDRAGAVGSEHELPMRRLFETQAFYQAEIQGSELAEGFLEYQIRAAVPGGAPAVWPGPEQWRRVPVTRDETGPTLHPLSAVVSPGSALLACEATDPAGVGGVWVRLRPLAARAPWQRVAMTLVGTRYTAPVALTGDGLQYQFEATDAWGNVSTAPDLLQATPYLVLRPAAAPPAALARAVTARPAR